MLVTRIIGDCPGCKKPNAYGNVDVFGDTLLRGCGYCKYKQDIWLPEITKDVVYLDQNFFSSAFRQGDERFVEAEKRIAEAGQQQLLTAPYSSLHEQETLMWKHRDELKEFIRKTARGAKLERQYQVEQTQVLKAFDAWRRSESLEYRLQERDAFQDDVDKWDKYFYITVAGYQLDPEELRRSKETAIAELVAIFDGWRKSKATFEQDVHAENLAAGEAYVRTYVDYATRMANGDPTAYMNSSIRAGTVESMMFMVKEKEPDYDTRLKLVVGFLLSDHFRNIPINWLKSRMFAVLKNMVRNGAYPNPEKAKDKLSGFFYDVDHIATYAPYCDAVVIDAAMAELVSHPQVDLEKQFGVRVFSLRNWDELYAWIDGLKAKLTPDHLRALEDIYPKRK